MFRSEELSQRGKRPGAHRSAAWAAKRVVRNQTGMLAQIQARSPPWVHVEGLRFHRGGP